MLILKIKRLNKDVPLPEKMSEQAAGLDIYMPKQTTVWADSKIKIGSGLAFEIPKGYHGEIHIRSSYGSLGIRLTNCTGIIDSDYRGEVTLCLKNDTKIPITIPKGDRVAQFILVKDPVFKIEEVEELGETERGEGGFGSTGRN